ncbi:MAG TPA: hypothetical protein VLT35_02205 [Methanocella sp.]|nr:hypothetical protein [Methanocella sp.]
MDDNNTTVLPGAAGAVDGTTTVDLANFILISLGIFVASWAILCVVMYFIAPFFGKFADVRSRVVYSIVYTFPFAVIFALGLGGTMSLLSQTNFLVSLVIAFVIVFVLVMFQSYVLGVLTTKGIIKMQSKASGASKTTVKGKRK